MTVLKGVADHSTSMTAMMDPGQLLLIILIAGGALLAIALSWKRGGSSYADLLAPVIEECGCKFISSRSPGLFRVGPFPKFESEFGRPQTSVLGVRGEHFHYRIVLFEDGAGVPHEVWALIEFESFKLRHIRWRAFEKEKLPAAIRELLEN